MEEGRMEVEVSNREERYASQESLIFSWQKERPRKSFCLLEERVKSRGWMDPYKNEKICQEILW